MDIKSRAQNIISVGNMENLIVSCLILIFHIFAEETNSHEF